MAWPGDDALAGRHVLIIVENLPLPFDRRVWQEARTLVSAGCRVSVICPMGKGHEAPFEEIEGVDIHRHPLPEAKGAAGYFKEYALALYHETRLAWRIFRRSRFDAVQLCNPPDVLFLAAWPFKFLYGVKIVFDHHDLCPELWEAKFDTKGFFHRMLLWAERLTFAAADISIATNESYKEKAVARGKMDPDKVVVVRSGPDLERVRPQPPNDEWRAGREHLVGYLGVMGPQEGVDHLLRAASILVHEQGRDVRFVLVGGGPALEDLRRQATELGLDEHVVFTGRIPDEPMLEALSTADVCVNPDKPGPMNDLSTMNKIMEYMGLGKPVVQYDLKEGRFSAREASLYARPGDVRDLAEKIAELLDDPAARERMGAFGRRRVCEELHWGVEGPKYLAAWRRLFGGCRPRGLS
jgi:glycosyltransferase involved in cell wall biosynthesis